MDTWMIVALVVVGLIVVVAVGTTPMLRKKESSAARQAKEELGVSNPRAIETKAVGFATRPEEAGGLRGMGVLAASDDAIVFVTWAPRAVFRIDRNSVTAVTSPVENVEDAFKAMIEVSFTADDGAEVVAPFRVPEPTYWLDALEVDSAPSE